VPIRIGSAYDDVVAGGRVKHRCETLAARSFAQSILRGRTTSRHPSGQRNLNHILSSSKNVQSIHVEYQTIAFPFLTTHFPSSTGRPVASASARRVGANRERAASCCEVVPRSG